MKKAVYLLLLLSCWVYSQESNPQYQLEAGYYYGSIIPHSQKIVHLIRQHPEGLFIGVNRKTFGEKAWQSRLNYPDYGLSFHYQNNKNEVLGDLYGLYFHYNFYFFHRHLQFRIAEGIAYNTNPYHRENNYRNLAYGLNWMPATYFMLNYQKENIWEGIGLRAGIFMIHHSNAKLKTPNTSTNTVGANVSLIYNIDYQQAPSYLPRDSTTLKYSEPIKLNLAFRSGVHESHIIGSGRYPFYNFSAYTDKRVSKTSAFQLGVDLFVSRMRKREIKMMAVSFPEKNINSEADYKRLGAFVGYEFFINNLSFEPQLGFYIYNHYREDKVSYQRLSLKYYFYKNLFAGIGLVSQTSKAEAMEISLGLRI